MESSSILSHVAKPGRYLGHEVNRRHAPAADGDLLCALVFPDLYEIGMSHQGLHILYNLLNKLPNVHAERCYCPAPDAENYLRYHAIPLTSLESGRPLADFDLIGITLPYELSYTNILTILDLAQIPFQAAHRSGDNPIIIGGGPLAFNPEPVAEFFDAILLGDGEDAIEEIARSLLAAKHRNVGRSERIDELRGLAGIYLPADFIPKYNADGSIYSICSLHPEKMKIRRRVISHLDRIDHLLHPLVPNIDIVHNRLGVEIARGCTRGCRFCQAGIIYRPVRERGINEIMSSVEAGLANSGFDEIALLSLSTGDYSCLSDLVKTLMRRLRERRVSVSLPSMRVGTLAPEVMEEIKSVRKTGFTLAPEAGSERLRRVINKGISEDNLLQTAIDAARHGWRRLKLYFMIGLPTEGEDDIAAIGSLVEKTLATCKQEGFSRIGLTVSVGTFVPKPHTPFQWEPQLSLEASRKRIGRLKTAIRNNKIVVKYHNPEQSFLEGVFARGDRRLAELIIAAWHNGARLDGWEEHFDLATWQAAAHARGLELTHYLRRRHDDEVLPWHHLDSGVSETFLLAERDKAYSEGATADCRGGDCQGCGLCDFTSIAPVTYSRSNTITKQNELKFQPQSQPDPHAPYRYLLSYSRVGDVRFLGHLDFIRIMNRAIRRVGIFTCFSQGFNPQPKLSFSPALPVGTESLCEFFSMQTPEPLESDSVLQSLNQTLPSGITITGIAQSPGKMANDIVCRYEITPARPLTKEQRACCEDFTAARNYIIEIIRKSKPRTLDIRPLIPHLDCDGEQLVTLDVIHKSSMPSVKPEIALAHIVRDATLQCTRIVKVSWRPLDADWDLPHG